MANNHDPPDHVEKSQRGSLLQQRLVRLAARQAAYGNQRQQHGRRPFFFNLALVVTIAVIAAIAAYNIYLVSVLLEQAARVGELWGRAAESARRAADIAQSTARSADQSLRIAHRAYVGIKRVHADVPVAEQPLRVVVAFSNLGNTPAAELAYAACVSISRKPTSDTQTVIEALAPCKPSHRPVLAPAADITRIALTDRVLSADVVEAIANRKMHVILVGMALYKDVFGDPHETQLCAQYDPRQAQFVFCPGFNIMK
jgi:hypothetical protein